MPAPCLHEPARGEPSAGRLLVDTLAGLGARHLYCVPGESFLEVLEAARKNPQMRLVSTRHESGASFMADADAKLSGVPAIAAATRAPGAANLSIGVHTAFHDSTPMIALIGHVESDLVGSDVAFQSIDLEAFYRPLTKWVATLESPADAVPLARAAFEAATSGRPGPVALLLPADVQAALVAGPPRTLEMPLPAGGGAVAAAPAASSTAGGAATPGSGADAPGEKPSSRLAPAPPELVGRLVEELAAASRPVVIVGGRTAGCERSLVRLAEQLGIGVYAAFRRQDHFPNEHPAYLGHLSTVTPPPITAALAEADLVLVLGCRLSEVTTQHFSLPLGTCRLVQIDHALDRLGSAEVVSSRSPARGAAPAGRRPDLGIVADVPATIEALVRSASRLRPSAGLERFAPAHRRYLEASALPGSLPRTAPGAGMHPLEVMAALVDSLPPDCILANDAGNFALFVNRYWRYRQPRSQLAPTSGAMGYGVPAAVAAGLWCPERLAVAVCGDGGYLMTGNELETAVRLGVKCVVVVMRNGLYGTIALHQARSFGALAAVEIGDVDLAGHARSLGAHGFSARERHELDYALREAVSLEGPALVDVVVDGDVLTPELRLSDLVGD